MTPVRFVVFMCLVLAACGGDGESAEEASPSASTTTTPGTSTTQATTTTTQPATSTSTTQATTTTTQPATTTSTTQAMTTTTQAAAAVGDSAAGEELFNTPLEGVPDSVSCSSCHLPSAEDSPWAPSLVGISAVAADRVDGMSDVEYLRQSIVDPFAFRVEGEWAFAMPIRYSEALSEDQIDNLVAFLLTQ